MHDKSTDEQTAQNDSDRTVMHTLLDDHWPWSVAELIRDRGNDDEESAVIDSINRLHRTGLIHRTQDDLVFPTRAAIYSEQIAG